MVTTLIRTYFRGNGGLSFMQSFKGRSRKRSAMLLYAFAFLYLMLFSMLGIFSKLVSYLSTAPSKAVLFALLSAFSIAVYITMTSVDNVLLKGRDLPLLRSLPVGEGELLLSRYLILLIEAVIEAQLVFIPFFIASLLLLEFNAVYYLLLIFSALTIPALSVSFMSLLSYLAARYTIVRYLKNILLWSASALMVLFIVFVYSDENFGVNGLDSYLPGSYRHAVSPSLIRLLLAGVVSSLILSVALLALSLHFSKGVELAVGEKSAGRRGAVTLKAHSQLQAMVSREMRIILSSSANYVELFGELLIPLILVILFAAFDVLEVLVVLADNPLLREEGAFFSMLLIQLIYSISQLSSTSVSREGRDFTLSRVYPVTVRTRVHAKLLLHLLLVIPFELCFTAISFVLTAAAPSEALLLLLSELPLTLCISLIGLNIDFRHPHTEWERPQEAVKQNVNVLLAFIFVLLFNVVVIVPAALVLVLLENRLLAALIMFLLPSLLAIPLYRLCLSAAKRLYEEKHD